MARFDLGAGAAGGLSGAAMGAQIGSVVPGVGTAIGALAGGLFGLVGGFKSSKGPKKLSTMDKRQQGLYNQYTDALQGRGPFADSFNFNPEQTRSVFNEMYAQPAYQQFQEEIVPSITGQFRGGNLGNSSYLGSALGKAGSDVQKNLNAQMSQMLYNAQQQSIERRLGSLRDILGMQTFAYQKPQPGPFDALLGGFSEGAGKMAANKLFGG